MVRDSATGPTYKAQRLHPDPRRTKPVVDEGTIVGSSGAEYHWWRYSDGSMRCTCPAWVNSHDPPQFRTCKHTRQIARKEDW